MHRRTIDEQKVFVKTVSSKSSWKRETKMLTKLHSPYIVNMISSTSNIIILEYLGDRTLAHVELAERRLVLPQLLPGVQYLQQQRVCHSDLKPSNIMISSDSKIKIIDFGVSVMFGERGHGEPQVLMGRRVIRERETDIWSLGMLCLFLLTDFETQTDKFPCDKIKHVEKMLSFLSGLHYEDPFLQFVLTKVLVFERSDRATIDEILDKVI